jgi:DNA-binding NarL/FixJ family response regulator
MRLLIADGDQRYRRSIRRFLETDADVSVVAEAADGKGTVSLCERLKPQVLVMDLDLPRCGGLEVIRTLKAEFPMMRVVMVCRIADEACRKVALDCGADAFLSKAAEVSSLLSAIRRGSLDAGKQFTAGRGE